MLVPGASFDVTGTLDDLNVHSNKSDMHQKTVSFRGIPAINLDRSDHVYDSIHTSNVALAGSSRDDKHSMVFSQLLLTPAISCQQFHVIHLFLVNYVT